AEVLEHEIKKVVRMVRAYPVARFERHHPECGRSACELAAGFGAHVRRIEELATGRTAEPARGTLRARGEILLDLELAYLGAHMALRAMPPLRWAQVIDAPAGLAPWRQARRGELLWLALREMVRHDRHFGVHLSSAQSGDEGPGSHDGGGPRRERPLRELIESVA
ncbi:MAG: hypothetical protein ABL977_05155, partial [Candidatus Eisenbacteria bacterium]